MNEPQLLRAAMHEVAHAAVAFLVGINVEFVTARPCVIDGRKYEGFCAFTLRFNHDLAGNPPYWLDRFARAMVAGRVMDEMVQGGELPAAVRRSWDGDAQMMMRRVLNLRDFETWHECAGWRDRILEETRRLLEEPAVKEGVVAIAERLLQSDRITGEEARAAFNAATQRLDAAESASP